jgi:hypothetical protein
MLSLFLYLQFRLIRYRLSLLLLSLCISKYLLHFSLLRSTSNRRIFHSRFEDHCEPSSLNLVFALKMKKHLESHSCCLQVCLASSKVVGPNASSYFLIMNIEIDFQILRLFGRETGAFEQEIILVGQIVYFVGFASYRESKLSFFDKSCYSH